jgi:hypothetical protein
MNPKAYFAGILTGAVCTLAGYLMSHSTPAMADPGGASGGMILATPSSSDAGLGSLVYVLKTDPIEDAALVCYRNTGKGDLELVSARRITYDLKVWNMGGAKGSRTPESIRDEIEKAEKDRKEHDKSTGANPGPK